MLALLAFEVTIYRHQEYFRLRNKLSPPPFRTIFHEITRQHLDNGIISCAKYVINYFFYKFGVEVCHQQFTSTVSATLFIFCEEWTLFGSKHSGVLWLRIQQSCGMDYYNSSVPSDVKNNVVSLSPKFTTGYNVLCYPAQSAICMPHFLSQVCFLLAVNVIGQRMDFYSMVHAFALAAVMYRRRRKAVAEIWPKYCCFLACMITFQYFVCIGIPPAACKGEHKCVHAINLCLDVCRQLP